MTDQTCRHGHHHCDECLAEELHRKDGAALKFIPTLVFRFKKDRLGLPVAWAPLQVSRLLVPKNDPKAGQILVAVSPTEVEWQDPPGVVRGED